MHPNRRESENGFAMLALVVIMLPLLFLIGSYLQTMAGRQSRLQTEILEEQALLDAESGVDVAVYEARRGNLIAGHNAESTFSGAIGGGTYAVTCTYLGDDDDDNDEDRQVDESDEDVYRVVSLGTHGSSRRRIAVYLAFANYLPTPTAMISVLSPTPADIRLAGHPTVDGRNHSLAGTLVGSSNTPGISILPPAPTSKITTLLSSGEAPQVLGNSPAPSVGQQTSFTQLVFDDVLAQVKNSAQIVVTNGTVGSPAWGNPTTGPQYVVYRAGDLVVSSSGIGAGLLVVDGNLRITGGFTWYGVVLVNGDLECSGNSGIVGAVILGTVGRRIQLNGNPDLLYSAEAVDLANKLTGRYVAYNGWQEISTNN